MDEWLLHTIEDFEPFKWVDKVDYGGVTVTEVDYDLVGICKAQVERVFKEIEKSLKHTYCADKKDGYEQYFIGAGNWQALRKEVGLEVKDANKSDIPR